MSDTTATRKAVVTTAQVAEAFGSYVAALALIGQDVKDHEFDKGFRGRGFAEYDGKGNVVRSFDTKEDALTTYGLTAKGMWLVLDAVELPVKDTEEHASEEAINNAIKAGEESVKDAPKNTRKAAQTPAA